MNETDFKAAFAALTGNPPFPWQWELHQKFCLSSRPFSMHSGPGPCRCGPLPRACWCGLGLDRGMAWLGGPLWHKEVLVRPGSESSGLPSWNCCGDRLLRGGERRRQRLPAIRGVLSQLGSADASRRGLSDVPPPCSGSASLTDAIREVRGFRFSLYSPEVQRCVFRAARRCPNLAFPCRTIRAVPRGQAREGTHHEKTTAGRREIMTDGMHRLARKVESDSDFFASVLCLSPAAHCTRPGRADGRSTKMRRRRARRKTR